MINKSYILCFFICIGLAIGFNARASVCIQVDTIPVYYNNPEYQLSVRQALIYQMQADSLKRMVERETALLALTSDESKQSEIRIAIRDHDRQSVSTQRQADTYFSRAASFTKPVEVKPTVEATVQQAQIETPAPVTIEPQKTTPKNVEQFAILPQSPYSPGNSIPIDEPLPDGVVYKIQLAAYGKPVADNMFKGLSPISGERLPNNLIRYYVGLFHQYASAETGLQKVREYGYKDAFIVAFYNKKSVSLNKAKEYEK